MKRYLKSIIDINAAASSQCYSKSKRVDGAPGNCLIHLISPYKGFCIKKLPQKMSTAEICLE